MIVRETFEIGLAKRWGERGEKEDNAVLAPTEQIENLFRLGRFAGVRGLAG